MCTISMIILNNAFWLLLSWRSEKNRKISNWIWLALIKCMQLKIFLFSNIQFMIVTNGMATKGQGNSSHSVDKPPLDKYLIGWHRLFGYLMQTISKPFKYFLDTNRSLQWKGRHVDGIFLNITAFPIQCYGYLKYQCLSCNCDICNRVEWAYCVASCAMRSTGSNDYDISNTHASFPGIIFKPKMNCRVRNYKRIFFIIMTITATRGGNVQCK